MTRRLGPIAALCVGVSTLVASCTPPGAEPGTRAKARHVLLISLDTLRADHLSAWGYHRPTSPFLEELAASGTRFSQSFVNTHGTPPSHATLFSSVYQETHGVSIRRDSAGKRDKRLPGYITTLPEILQKGGFRTVGVAAGGYLSDQFNFQQGFDVWESRTWNARRGAKAFAKQVVQASRESDRVFAFFHTYEIHSPYESPADDPELFGTFDSTVEPTNDVLRPIQNRAFEHLDREDFRALEAAYDLGIRHTDEVLRTLFSELDSLGFLDNALVIVTSDHGEEFGEHGGVLHPATLFDELLHVPLIMVGPGVPPGRVDGRLTSTVDIAPTILAWAGVGTPPFMEGRDLLEAVGSYDPDAAVFAQYGDLLYGIRTEDWKLVRRRDRVSLYDLRRDPGERRNVAEQHPEVAERLDERLSAWQDGRVPMVEASDLDDIVMTDDELRQLRALGYVE